MSYRQEYIRIKSYYLDLIYLQKKIFDNAYTLRFGELELKNMKLIYEIQKIDARIQAAYMNRISSNSKKHNFFTDGINNFDIYSDAIQRKELRNLELKIKNFEDKINNLDKSIEYYDNVENEISNKIRYYVEKLDPNINKIEDNEYIYEEFISILEDGNFDRFKDFDLKYKDIKNKIKHNSSKFYQDKINELLDKIKDNKLNYPLNQIDILMNDEMTENKSNQLLDDIKNSERTLKKLSKMYLLTSINNGLIN